MKKKGYFDLFVTIAFDLILVNHWKEVYSFNHQIFQGLSFLVIILLFVSMIFDVAGFIKQDKDCIISKYVVIPACIMYPFVYGTLSQNYDYINAGYVCVAFFITVFFYMKVLNVKK